MIENVEYFITNVSAPDMLFEPDEFGLNPTMRCTACCRGYWCQYQIKNLQFILQNLYMFDGDGKYPPLNGVDILSRKNVAGTEPDECSIAGHEKYADVNLFIGYNGKILVGKDEIYQFHKKGGIQNCWAYEKLLECTFENGKLVSLVDYSHVAEAIREYIREENLSAMFVRYKAIPEKYWGNLKWVLGYRYAQTDMSPMDSRGDAKNMAERVFERLQCELNKENEEKSNEDADDMDFITERFASIMHAIVRIEDDEIGRHED